MMRLSPHKFACQRPVYRGFTLIESAIVTVIIGVGVTAMLQLLASGTMTNGQASEVTVAINLAGHIREMTLGMAFADPQTPTNWGVESGESSVSVYDDLDDLDGKVFGPPLDARRVVLSNLTNWSQKITVQTVAPDFITSVRPDGSEPMSRITVTVEHNGRDVHQMSWLAVAPE